MSEYLSAIGKTELVRCRRMLLLLKPDLILRGVSAKLHRFSLRSQDLPYHDLSRQ